VSGFNSTQAPRLPETKPLRPRKTAARVKCRCCAASDRPQLPARKAKYPQLRPSPWCRAIRGDLVRNKAWRLTHTGIRCCFASVWMQRHVRRGPIADLKEVLGLTTGRRHRNHPGACALNLPLSWSLMRANPLHKTVVRGWLLPGAAISPGGPPCAMSCQQATSQASGADKTA